MKIKNSDASWQSRAILQGPATGRWLNVSKASGRSGSKNLKHERKAPRLFATLEAEIGSCTVSNQTQTVVH